MDDVCPLSLLLKGLDPEVVPSTFEETLPHSSFEDLHEYPVATASEKAVEVYERLIVCSPAYLANRSIELTPARRHKTPTMLLILSLEVCFPESMYSQGSKTYSGK